MTLRGRPKGDDSQKHKILAAVIRLTVRQNSSTVNLRAVAEEARVSVGMIQHHFHTRDNLMDEASKRYLLDVVSELRRIASEDLQSWDKLMRFCQRVGSPDDYKSRVIIWIDLVSQATRRTTAHASVLAVNEAWTDLLTDLINEGTERGDFAPREDSRTVAQQLVALVDGLDVAAATSSPGVDSGWRDNQLYAVAGALLGRGRRACYGED